MEKIVKAEVRCMHVDVCVFLYMEQLLVAFSALTVEYFVRLVLRWKVYHTVGDGLNYASKWCVCYSC